MFPQPQLTLADIKAAFPKAKPYKLAIGSGMYLAVMPNGAKYWRLKYRFEGKERTLAIGVYPKVSYEQALNAREQAKALLKRNIDPSRAKQDAVSRAKREAAKLKVTQNFIRQSVFRIDLSHDGGVTIEANAILLKLTSAQTKALKQFLIASLSEG